MASVEPMKFTWVVDPTSGQRTKKPARNTTWRARYRDPDGGTRSKTFDRKADAEQFLADNQVSLRAGDWTDPEQRRLPLADWAALWFETTARLSPSTRRAYERMLRLYILPGVGRRPIGTITWMDVELFINKLTEDGLSPKTIRHTVSVLALIFKTAMRGKVLTENPATQHAISIRRARPNILTMDQVHQLVAHTDEWFRPAVWLLVLAGLRTSELCGLRLCDLDSSRKTITITEVQMWVTGELIVKGPKTESGHRTIPIPEWLVGELLGVAASRQTNDGVALGPADRFFVSRRGSPMTDNRVWKIIDRARRAAGLPPFRPYDLRHSHASLLIELGAHPKAISERMGHSEIGVTMNVYGHLFEGAQQRLTDQLDELVSDRRPNPEAEG